MSTTLPVADGRSVRRYAVRIARRHPRLLWSALGLHVLAAVATLAAPRLLGDLVEAVEDGTTVGYVDRVVLVLAGFVVASAVLTRYARYVSQVLGEQVLAELREDFVGNALALPVGVVESAGSGRPAHPYLPRRRPARVVGAMGAARVDDRGGHRRAHLRCGAVGRLVGGGAVPAGDAAPRGRPAVVPRPGQGRLPARVGDVLPDQRHADRDRRGRPHRGGPRPGRGAGTPSRRGLPPVLLGRALHPLPAHRVLPEHGAVLPGPHRAHPAHGWLAVLPGHGLAGRGDRGDALRPDAHRPGRPHRLHPRRAADGRGLAGPPARRGPGARRPRGQRPRAGGREARRTRRPLRLRHRPRRAARRLARRGRGGAAGHGRAVGGGQVHARSPARRDPPTPHR